MAFIVERDPCRKAEDCFLRQWGNEYCETCPDFLGWEEEVDMVLYPSDVPFEWDEYEE